MTECGICMEKFGVPERIPKVLKCGHTYCSTCVVTITVAEPARETFLGAPRGGNNSVLCPSCRARCFEEEVKTNYALMDIVQQQQQQRVHPASGSRAVNEGRKCKEHKEDTIDAFCETCTEFICRKCYVSSGVGHANHNRMSLEQAIENSKFRASSMIPEIDYQRRILQQHFLDNQNTSRNYLAKIEDLANQGRAHFAELKSKLQQEEQTFLDRLSNQYTFINQEFLTRRQRLKERETMFDELKNTLEQSVQNETSCQAVESLAKVINKSNYAQACRDNQTLDSSENIVLPVVHFHTKEMERTWSLDIADDLAISLSFCTLQD